MAEYMGARLPDPMCFTGNVSENFKKFRQNFEIYILASNKSNASTEVKVAMLLNCMGQEGINVYNTLKFESETDKKNYEKVMEQFQIYANPRRNVIYERFIFFSRKQEEGECVDYFVNDLKKLAKNCEFGTQEESLIRDRIVLGINDSKLQEKLLAKDDLNLDKAIQDCRVNEVSKTQIKALQDKGVNSGVNQIKGKYRRQSGYKKLNEEKTNKSKGASSGQEEKFLCYRCKEQHGPRQCKAYGKQCKTCGLMNHFAKACRVRQVKEITQEENVSEDEIEIHTITVSRDKYIIKSVNDVSSQKVWYKDVEICKQNFKFKLDTGSEVNILPLRIYKNHLSHKKLEPTNILLEAYGGFKIKPVGKFNVICNSQNKKYNVTFIVADVKSTPILGLKTCSELGFIKQVNNIVPFEDKE